MTAPFKEQAFAMVDDYSEYAGQAKAVNTILLKNGRLYGENTDGIGLMRDLQQHLKWPIQNKRILLLGAGGAIRGILPALIAAAPAEISIMNRTVEKAQQLAETFDLSLNISGKYDVVIDGISGKIAFPEIEMDYYYRMAYDESSLPKARITSANGWGMLVEQAAESFFLWRGIRPETQSIYQEGLR